MLQELTLRVRLCGGVTLSAHRILSSYVNLVFILSSIFTAIYMYVCNYVCVCVYVFMYVCMCIHTHIHTYIYTYMCVCVCVCVCEVCVFHVCVAKLDCSFLNLASHLQKENKKYLFCCKYARERPLRKPRCKLLMFKKWDTI